MHSLYVDKYQLYSKEWNKFMGIRSVKMKMFKEAVHVLGTSSLTLIRRFKRAFYHERVHLTNVF